MLGLPRGYPEAKMAGSKARAARWRGDGEQNEIADVAERTQSAAIRGLLAVSSQLLPDDDPLKLTVGRAVEE
jgi:hypothetical protein